MWANFHTHSKYCDGKGELTEYVQQAQALGMVSIGFSSHAPLPLSTAWTMKSERFPEYLAEIDAIKAAVSDIQVYKGLEVDFIPSLTSPNLFKENLDYTIGSIHFVEKFSDGTGWEIDGTHALFLEGFTKIFNSNIRDTITRYYELTRQMITTACPSIIGHVDKIKIQNIDGKFFSETDLWYRTEIKKTIDLIYASGAIVEVNTRGIYKKKSATTYPSPWVLEMLHEKNIPVTISSDAHHKDDLTSYFSETAVLLNQIGFRTITVLLDGVWQALPYDANGIKR
jgi:histidinol-phosphatase (PHP family)